MDWKAADSVAVACYGEAEIAILLGVSRSAVSQMRRRGNCFLPEEDALLAMGPVWFPDSIDSWLATEIERRQLSTPVAPAPHLETDETAASVLEEVLDSDADRDIGALTMAFAMNAARAAALHKTESEWVDALTDRHPDDSFLFLAGRAQRVILGLNLWPWRVVDSAT